MNENWNITMNKVLLSLFFIFLFSFGSNHKASLVFAGDLPKSLNKIEQLKPHLQKKIEDHKMIVASDPNNPENYYNLAWVYLNVNLLRDAAIAFKKAIKLNPNFSAAYHGLGISYSYGKMSIEAIETYKQAIKLDPTDCVYHESLGKEYLSIKQYFNSVRALSQAMEIDSERCGCHIWLGSAYSHLNQHAEAAKAYKCAIDRLSEKEEIKKALAGEDFEKGWASAFLSDFYVDLGKSYAKLGDNKHAADAFKEAIRLLPDSIGAHFGLGVVHAISGNVSNALKEYKILKNIDKEYADLLFKVIYP